MSIKIADLRVKIGADTEEVEKGLENTKEKISDIGKSSGLAWMEFNSAVDLAARGIEIAGQAYDAIINQTLDYGDSVRQLTAISGASAEQTSRMIQMVDDLGIDLGTLETAAKGAAQKGIALTVEELARMSDEYRALKDPVAQNNYLLDNFGRSGLKMAVVLQKTREELLGTSSAISDNLLLTDKAVQQQREYEIAVDDLNDSLTGLKYSLADGIFPSLTEFVNFLSGPSAQSAADFLNTVFQGTFLEDAGVKTMREGSEAVTSSYTAMARAAENGTLANGGFSGSIDAVTKSSDLAAESMKKLTLEMYFQKASEGMSADAVLALQRSLGLLDDQTFTLLQKLDSQKKLFDGNKLSADEYTRIVNDLWNTYSKFQSKVVTLTFNTIGSLPTEYLPTLGNENNCFVGYTLVDTPEGRRRIDCIRKGDKVLVCNEDGRVEIASVKVVISSFRADLVTVTTSPGTQIHCSPNHRFKTVQGWIEANKLPIGEFLVSPYKDIRVESVKPYPGEYEVFNLEIDHPDHTYMVYGCVVHNIKARANGGSVLFGRPYLVGEEGPELFVPQGNGNIIPSDQIGGNVINFEEGAIQVNAKSDLDIPWMAQEIVNEIRRRRL